MNFRRVVLALAVVAVIAAASAPVTEAKSVRGAAEGAATRALPCGVGESAADCAQRRRRLDTTQETPFGTITVSTKVQIWSFMAVGAILCFFGYQVHSFVFLVTSFLVGWYMFALICAWAAGSVAAAFDHAGIVQWVIAIMSGIGGVVSAKYGLHSTASIVGTSVWYYCWGLFLFKVVPDNHTATTLNLIIAGTCLVFVLVFEGLFMKFPRTMLISGTAGLGAILFVSHIGVLMGDFPDFMTSVSKLSVDAHSSGTMTKEVYYQIGMIAAFIVGLLLQIKLASDDEHDIFGNRRWLPTNYRLNRPKRGANYEDNAEAGTQLERVGP